MRRFAVLVAALLALTGLLATPSARAAPQTPPFGPLIEGHAVYEGQSRCAPKEKPGVTAFRKLLVSTYGETWMNSSRPCNVGGKSEHKEGRALDWAMDASKPRDRKKVKDLFDWMFAEDARGNINAMARRLGLMYVIWNRRWWTSWKGTWKRYCVQKPRGCRTPSGSFTHPHDDHVHFSFSWQGARKRTSFFTPERSFITGMAASSGGGYWLAGGDGSVRAYAAPFHGSKAGKFPPAPIVEMASRPDDDGYWLVLRSGRVLAFGEAGLHGRVTRKKAVIVGFGATATGEGYWLLTKQGKVAAFGDAGRYGRVEKGAAAVTGIVPTPSGQGYWVYAAGGEVFAFGDAEHQGDLADASLAAPIVGGAASGPDGYWLVTRKGNVHAFGSAQLHGQAANKGLGPVAAIAASPSGSGYWVVGRTGRVAAFGDAKLRGSL
ncbi:MAG TPA: hypothetical protein VF097_08380 [Actinomycetota bacterium]